MKPGKQYETRKKGTTTIDSETEPISENYLLKEPELSSRKLGAFNEPQDSPGFFKEPQKGNRLT